MRRSLFLLFPLAATAACASLLGLDPVELATGTTDAGAGDASVDGPKDPLGETGAEAGCVETPKLADGDPCAAGLAGAESTLFGELSSELITVTPDFVYANVANTLRRYDRSLFGKSGRDVLPQCQGARIFPLGLSDALVEITPFDRNGVCVLVSQGGVNRVGCARSGEASLSWAPALAADGAALSAPTHVATLGDKVFTTVPWPTGGSDVIVQWSGRATDTPTVAFAEAGGRCPGPGRSLGAMTSDGKYIYLAATTSRGDADGADCRKSHFRRFAPDGSLDSMVATTAAESYFPVEVSAASVLEPGVDQPHLAGFSGSSLVIFQWGRETDQDTGANPPVTKRTSQAWGCLAAPPAVAVARRLPGAISGIAYTRTAADAGVGLFELARSNTVTVNPQTWSDECKKASGSVFRGSAKHAVVAEGDSLFLAVRPGADCKLGYIARTK